MVIIIWFLLIIEKKNILKKNIRVFLNDLNQLIKVPLQNICFFCVFCIVFCFVVNLCTLGYSISVGWTASSFLIYDSDDCPLPTGRLNMNEIAWIGSVLGIGGLIGTILVGWIADHIGRKNSLLALAVPQIVSSILIRISF